MGKRIWRWRATGIITVLLVIVLTAGGIVWTIRANWTAERLKFAPAEQGQIKHEVAVTATFANQETLLPAPVGGKVEYSGTDGQRFRRGEQVATITPDGMTPGGKPATGAQAVFASASGLLFRETDGLETIFTPTNLMNMDLSQLLVQTAKPRSVPSTVQAGGAVGKIVNNLQPSVAFIELPSLQEVATGKYVNLIVHDQAQRAKVLRKSQNPQGVVVQFPVFLSGTVENRRQQVVWVASAPVNGIIVPAQALWTQAGDQGVLAVIDGIIRFRKVSVQDRDGDRVCVTGLAAGTFVVTNPRVGIEGQPGK